MATLTRDQRNAVFYALGHIIRAYETDPHGAVFWGLHTSLKEEQKREVKEHFRIWADSWVAAPLAGLLADDDATQCGERLLRDYAIDQWTEFVHQAGSRSEIDEYVRRVIPDGVTIPAPTTGTGDADG